jgi:hypothetical protein
MTAVDSLADAAERGLTDALFEMMPLAENISLWTIQTTLMPKAAAGGYVAAMKLLLEWTVSLVWVSEDEYLFDEALAAAATNGHLEAMKLLKDWGVRDYDWALAKAAEGNHLEAMKLLRTFGARGYNRAFGYAAGES